MVAMQYTYQNSKVSTLFKLPMDEVQLMHNGRILKEEEDCDCQLHVCIYMYITNMTQQTGPVSFVCA